MKAGGGEAQCLPIVEVGFPVAYGNTIKIGISPFDFSGCEMPEFVDDQGTGGTDQRMTPAVFECIERDQRGGEAWGAYAGKADEG